jgi:MFS family permease
MTIAPDSRTSPWQGLPPTVWVLVAARAVNRLGAFTLPFLGVVLTVELGATLAQTGLILTLFGLATIPSRIFGGHLADRLGRRSTIVLGLTGCALAQTWIALSSSLWSAVLAVTLLGLVFEIYEPPSQATIADVTQPTDRPAAYGLLGSAMAAAAVVAGLLAAALSHWNLRWLFAIDAITCLACAALIAFALPSDTRAVGNAEPATHTAAWRDRRLLILLLSGTVFAALYMQLILGLPLTLIERNLPTSSIGILLTVSALTLIAGQRLLRTNRLRGLDDFTGMTIGYVLLAIGLFVNGQAHSLPVFLAATVIWSLGDLLLLGRYYTIVSAIAPDHARGRYLALFGISWGIATTVAPMTVTQLLETTGPAGLWTGSALAAVVLAVLQPTIRRRLSPPKDVS